MKISILSSDLSHNCLGRAYLLAKILQRHYKVEIVGPDMGEGIWQPVINDTSIDYKSVHIDGGFDPCIHIDELIQNIDGDVIYASKPLYTSFGVGMLIKLIQDKPLILDIDDWELGFKIKNYENLNIFGSARAFVSFFLFRYGMGRYWNSLFEENLVSLSKGITVPGKLLNNRFKGVENIDKFSIVNDIFGGKTGFAKKRNITLSRSGRVFISSRLFRYGMRSYWNILLMEKLAVFADEITVSNRFLKNKFGGTIIYHGRDVEAFNPDKFCNDSLREKYGIEKSCKIVMFVGSPKSHKGIDDLIKAVSLINDKNILLVVVGMDDKSKYCKQLSETAKGIINGRFKEFGLQPFDKIPEFLAMADVVVIPQRKNLSTMGQMPAKVFDAMAMAKPIIVSDVCDLSEIIDGCGWVVPPGSPGELAVRIRYVLNHPDEAEEMGNRARRKCMERYSWNAIEEICLKLFRNYEKEPNEYQK